MRDFCENLRNPWCHIGVSLKNVGKPLSTNRAKLQPAIANSSIFASTNKN